MLKQLIAAIVLIATWAVCSPLIGQDTAHPISLSVEFQAYPTGLIPGLRLDYHFKTRHSLHLRAGYNWIRHGDQGVQDNEEGDGFGGTFGYRYHFRDNSKGWLLGARTDFWFNRLDWQNKDDQGNILDSGTSKIVVWQPTAEAGYRFPLGNSSWFLTPALAVGVEINVATDGAAVGQGAILLAGFSAGTSF